MSIRSRIVGFFYGQDEAANALLGGRPTETLSGTIGRAAEAGDWFAVTVGQPLVNWLMHSPTHCQDAAAAEAKRRAADNG